MYRAGPEPPVSAEEYGMECFERDLAAYQETVSRVLECVCVVARDVEAGEGSCAATGADVPSLFSTAVTS